jgi:hypothetical protein
MSNIIRIIVFIITPFIFIFGGGGLMVTFAFVLIGLLDNLESNIIIIGFIGTAFIVFMIINTIIYIIDLFIRDIHNTNIYKKRSFWYMCIIIIISRFYYSLYENLKNDYLSLIS